MNDLNKNIERIVNFKLKKYNLENESEKEELLKKGYSLFEAYNGQGLSDYKALAKINDELEFVLSSSYKLPFLKKYNGLMMIAVGILFGLIYAIIGFVCDDAELLNSTFVLRIVQYSISFCTFLITFLYFRYVGILDYLYAIAFLAVSWSSIGFNLVYFSPSLQDVTYEMNYVFPGYYEVNKFVEGTFVVDWTKCFFDATLVVSVILLLIYCIDLIVKRYKFTKIAKNSEQHQD